LILLAGGAHLGILLASALVPFRLSWRTELAVLSRLHRQMYWTYGGFVVPSIVTFALISLFNVEELAHGGLTRGFCLQLVFDVKVHLTRWWLRAGYHLLTALFICFAALYGWAALRPSL
jgi:hypothetical protein